MSTTFQIQTKCSGYALLSSDYSQQEPKITAFISGDEKMIGAFKDGRDIYATIGAGAYGVPYEQCRETTPDGAYNPAGAARRSEMKTILLGITYGRSVVTIADQMYGDLDISDDEKIQRAQRVYDSVLVAIPGLRNCMVQSQNMAKRYGYVETVFGRRRHIPDMQLPMYDVHPTADYKPPNLDPLDRESLASEEVMPDKVKQQIVKELTGLKYWGQVNKRIRELSNQGIRVVNNRRKIDDAVRQCLNSRVQGTAADMTKLAMLILSKDEEWKKLGGRLLLPVHDELIAEAPTSNVQACADRLEQAMNQAAEFLPFPSKCDVTITWRWYGLDYRNSYSKPQSLQDMAADEIAWVQYHLHEVGYPLFDKPDKNKKGDAAVGVDGVWTEACSIFVKDYMKWFRISSDSEFLDHIEHYVTTGSLAR